MKKTLFAAMLLLSHISYGQRRLVNPNSRTYDVNEFGLDSLSRIIVNGKVIIKKKAGIDTAATLDDVRKVVGNPTFPDYVPFTNQTVLNYILTPDRIKKLGETNAGKLGWTVRVGNNLIQPYFELRDKDKTNLDTLYFELGPAPLSGLLSVSSHIGTASVTPIDLKSNYRWSGAHTFTSRYTLLIDTLTAKRLVLNGRGLQAQSADAIANDTLQVNLNGGAIQFGKNSLFYDAAKKTLRIGDNAEKAPYFNTTADIISTGSTTSGGIPKFTMQGIGHQSYFSGHRINGSYESPTSLNNNDLIVSFLGGGYDGTHQVITHSNEIKFLANENWNGTTGSRTEFWNTVIGQNAPVRTAYTNNLDWLFSNNVYTSGDVYAMGLRTSTPVETGIATDYIGTTGDGKLKRYPFSTLNNILGLGSNAFNSTDFLTTESDPAYKASYWFGKDGTTLISNSTSGTAANVPFTGVTGKPTTRDGYGITDVYTATQSDNRFPRLELVYQNPTWMGSLDYNKILNPPPIITPVQPDINQTDNTKLDYIKNQKTKLSQFTNDLAITNTSFQKTVTLNTSSNQISFFHNLTGITSTSRVFITCRTDFGKGWTYLDATSQLITLHYDTTLGSGNIATFDVLIFP